MLSSILRFPQTSIAIKMKSIQSVIQNNSYILLLVRLLIVCHEMKAINGEFDHCSGRLLSENICLPDNYHKSHVPEKPILVNISLVIPNRNGLRDVDDDKMTITIDLHIMQYWVDNRILTNFSQDEILSGRIPFGVEQIKHIWKPDLYIYNTSSFRTLSTLDPLAGLAILKNFYWKEEGKRQTIHETLIEYYVEAEVTIYCNFNLYLYPMDEQDCEFKIGSANHGRNIQFQLVESLWKNMYDTHFYHAKDFYVEVSYQESQNDYLGNDFFSDLKEVGFKLKLTRCLLSYVFKYYLPCAAIVIISQISFLIPPEQVPARIALLVTTFLILVNIFIGQQVSMKLHKINFIKSLSIFFSLLI